MKVTQMVSHWSWSWSLYCRFQPIRAFYSLILFWFTQRSLLCPASDPVSVHASAAFWRFVWCSHKNQEYFHCSPSSTLPLLQLICFSFSLDCSHEANLLIITHLHYHPRVPLYLFSSDESWCDPAFSPSSNCSPAPLGSFCQKWGSVFSLSCAQN